MRYTISFIVLTLYIFLYILIGKTILFSEVDPNFYGYTIKYYIYTSLYYIILVILSVLLVKSIVINEYRKKEYLNLSIIVVSIALLLVIVSNVVDHYIDNFLFRFL